VAVTVPVVFQLATCRYGYMAYLHEAVSDKPRKESANLMDSLYNLSAGRKR